MAVAYYIIFRKASGCYTSPPKPVQYLRLIHTAVDLLAEGIYISLVGKVPVGDQMVLDDLKTFQAQFLLCERIPLLNLVVNTFSRPLLQKPVDDL